MRARLDQLRPELREQATLELGISSPKPAIDERKFPAPAARKNAKNDGREFQKEMEATADAYAEAGIARLKKADPPMRVIWIDDAANPGKKRNHFIYMKNPHLDYVGVWTAKAARSLMIEAKSTSSHRLPFNGASGFKEEQMTNLNAWHAKGAVAALVWKFNDEVRVWTADMLRSAEEAGAKSLLFWDGLKVVRRATGQWDFLGALSRALWPANRVEVTYRGHVVHLVENPRGWRCETLPSLGAKNLEQALQVVDALENQNCSTFLNENKSCQNENNSSCSDSSG
jgi:penicillin-binding protein-related factor A (putative recombinase)